jgi:NhaP-type Na+/H+ or K+/H+ antiporter
MSEQILIQLATIGIIAITCQWFAWLVKVPAILFLLLAGILAGPVSGWLQPNVLFGELLFPIVSLGVAVILFEGSLTLKIHEIRGLETVVRRFVTSGLLSTWLVVTVAAHYLLSLSWPLAFLFGAVMVVTGPTVIVPLLRTVRPNARIANILRWEGIIIDPIGALLAVLVYEFIISGEITGAFGHTVIIFGQTILTGVALGVLSGYLFGLALRKHWLPDYLHNVAALTLVFGVFALSNHVQHESGLLAVTVMGMWLANMKSVHTEEILNFKESLSVLMISGLFIILAARIDFSDIRQIAWSAVGVFLVMQFAARPLKVIIATWQSPLNWREKVLLSWIAPRGIVAAAVISLFSIQLEKQQVAGAQLLVPLTFIMIIGTVVLQSATAGLLARKLKVAEPDPKGFLIIGANTVARAIAKSLLENGYRALLTDSSWDNIRSSRLEGINCYYGNPVSEHADRHLDLIGIGRLLGLSPHDEINALASVKYARDFGRGSIYTLASASGENENNKHQISQVHRGNVLFGKDATFSKLASLLGQGAEIHTTRLSEDFNFETYQEKYSNNHIKLYAIDSRDKLYMFTVDSDIEPKPEWKIISLIFPEKDKRD